MTCPACQRALVELTVADITLDVCHGGCGGIWFDADELERLNQSEEEGDEFALSIPVDPTIEVDESLPRRCPRCESDSTMKQVFVGGEEEGVSIDVCENCGGTWLDHGELEWIQEQ
jgi:Zn-finger nucleic acid-binding protein